MEIKRYLSLQIWKEQFREVLFASNYNLFDRQFFIKLFGEENLKFVPKIGWGQEVVIISKAKNIEKSKTTVLQREEKE